MADISVFDEAEFQITALAASIQNTAYIPGRLGALGLFQAEGINSPFMEIEKEGDKLALVAAAERGAPAQITVGNKRNMIPFKTIHLPQQTPIKADQIAGVRAFGSQTEVQAMETVVQAAQAQHRRQLDATIEHLRIGASKGILMDADGVTPLVNLFTAFGITQQVFQLSLNDQNADIRAECMALKDAVEDALGGISFTGVRIPCGRTFFRKLTGHDKVKAAYERYENGAKLRDDVREGFEFGGIIWEQYRGQVGGVKFIPDAEAQVLVEGSPDMYLTRFAPADYIDTVGTTGLPYYSQIEIMGMKKGVLLESQSNPLCLCTRPKAAIKVTILP